MRKKVVRFSLCAVIILGIMLSMNLLANAAVSDMSQSDYDSKVNSFINDSRWKNNASWGAGQSPKLSSWSSSGCFAYTADFVKYMFNRKAPQEGNEFTNAAEIRAGDVVYADSTPHYIVVLSRSGNKLRTAEGNWGGKVRISDSAYYISGSTVLCNNWSGFYYNKAYHQVNITSSDPVGTPVNVGNDFYTRILKRDAWKAVTYDKVSNVFLQTIYEVPNQIWHFQRQNDGTYKITNLYNGTALEVQYESTASGANIGTYEWWNGNSQKWYVYGSDNRFKLRAKNTNYVMDVVSNCNDDGTNVATYIFNDTAAQNFHFAWVDVKPATLLVNVGSSSKETVFSWDGATFATRYNLKIWKGELWNGDAYNIQWGAEGGSSSILLPEGHYEAYVDTQHGETIDMGNVVKFDVQRGAPANTHISSNKSQYVIGETIKMNFSCIDANSVSICISKDGHRILKSDVTGTSEYSFLAEDIGTYTAYLSAWNPVGYIDSQEINFTVIENGVFMQNDINISDDVYELSSSVANLTHSATYAVASYTSDNRLLDVQLVNLQSGAQTVEVSLTKREGAKYIKVFLWDSVSNMTPLCDYEKIDL